MVQNATKKRVSSRLKLSGTSLEKAKGSVRGLRSNKKLRNSVNKSVKSNTSQTNNVVPEKKRVVSRKRRSVSKINATPVRKTRKKRSTNKSNNESQTEKDVSVKPKKAVAVKNNKKTTKSGPVNNKKDKLNDSTALRQMSLKESFSKQVVSARLRPRTNGKNYCEDSMLSSTKNVKKGPVYKHVNVSDDVNPNKNDVYDFKFDDNDSRERIVKKKKRRVMRRGVLKTNLKKKVVTNRGESAKTETKAALNENSPEFESQFPEVASDNNAEPVKPEMKNKNVQDASVKVTETIDGPNASLDVEPADSFVFLKPTENVEQSKETTGKPRIVSVDLIKNGTVTMIPRGRTSDDSFRTFDRPDIFAKQPNQYRSMMNHSLLNRSLSPIVKTSENFDVGSPWRPPQISAFSHVKDLFQSTPQGRKTGVYTGKTVRNVNNIENMAPKRLEVVESTEKNRKSSLTRKFGTEITNIDSSIPSSPNVNEDRNERVPELPTIQSVQPELPVITVSPNVSFNDVAEDKENAAPNFQTPKKILKKKKKKRQTESLQTLHKVLGRKVLQTKENLEPQPGPSGIQKLSPPKEDRVLRQSNLSGFLNLAPMPESSMIITPHGIFDDAHSTPVNGRQPKKVQKSADAVENAFGFVDSDSDLDISPVNADVQAEDVKNAEKPAKLKTETVIPARLSVGEIQRKLLVPKRAKHKDPVQKKITEEPKKVPEREKREHYLRKKVLIDVSNFSDTFDVLSETGDSLKDESIKDVPLFADLEPSRFTEPPKHSYKRKRNVKFSFSDESNAENMDGSYHEPEVKKKRGNKFNRADEERLKNWVESVNQTFSEIDQFDLVVE